MAAHEALWVEKSITYHYNAKHILATEQPYTCRGGRRNFVERIHRETLIGGVNVHQWLCTTLDVNGCTLKTKYGNKKAIMLTQDMITYEKNSFRFSIIFEQCANQDKNINGELGSILY